MKNPVSMIVNKLPKIKKALSELTDKDVLVGVPADRTSRKDDVGINNATLAYIMDKGSPAQNIPARPFMEPGIENGKADMVEQLKRCAAKATKGRDADLDVGLNRAGMIAQRSIRQLINDGINPPLAKRTLAARRRRGRKGEKPLVDTGQLRNSINYILRKK